jgi:hypothetical protein
MAPQSQLGGVVEKSWGVSSAIRRLSCTLSPAKFLENEVPITADSPNLKLTHYRHIAFAPRAGRDLSPGTLFLCQKKDPAEAGSSSVASRVSGCDGHPVVARAILN